MISNLLLLTGEDSYRLFERSRLYQKKFQEKYEGGEIDRFGENSDFHEFESAVLTPNLFGGKRMLVCEDFWNADRFEQAQKSGFFDRLPDFAEQSTVLVILPKIDKRLKFSKFFLGNAKVESFEPLDENEILRWIEKHAQKHASSIGRSEAQSLMRRCGTDLWNLSSEIQKLALISDGKITATDIASFTIAHPQMEIWDFTEKLSRRDANGAIDKFRTLLQMGQTPHQIFPMIQREIRIHAQLRAGIDQRLSPAEIAAQTKLHPFVVKKTIGLTQNFSQEKIQTLYDILFTIDKKLKTGGLYGTSTDTEEFELEIERFILTACQ